MKFEQYQKLVRDILTKDEAGGVKKRFDGFDTQQMNPLVLAYIGDAYFHLFVRTHLLDYEQAHVQALHDLAARIVSAVWQAKAYKHIEPMLTDEEKAIYRRARNHRSHATRAASIAEYHASTGFEALLGRLMLDEKKERLEEITDAAFTFILGEMMKVVQEKKG
jgi:cysteine--tRNA ligase